VTRARLTRTVGFSAAHRYHRPEWTDEENHRAFGACANAPGHGHNYRCSVTVSGEVSVERGMVFDLVDFDALLHREIVSTLDHQHINLVVPEFAYGKQIPTAEALAVYLWQRLDPHLPQSVTLASVRIEEDETLHAQYDGE
jgi:6-pyruvoyltetrahydropterin/6-carboxytetrahydropterin synthase